MRILSAAGMKEAEQAAVLAGASFESLMETAGAKSAAEIQRLAGEQNLPHSVLMLCGKGNNAGDAFVAARHLAQAGWRVQIVLLLGQERLSNLARHNQLRLPATVQTLPKEQADYDAAFLVDGVFGTGFSGTLPTAVQSAFQKANAAHGVRVALDVPSGLDCDTGDASEGSFHARYTLTFGAYKPGLLVYGNKGRTGDVLLLDIGV